MAGPGGFRRAGAAALLVALLLAGLPARAAGSDGGIVLATHVLSSVAADLDGDGAKEIAAVIADPEDGSTLRVTAWALRGGSWVTLGEDTIEHWQAGEGTSQTARLGGETAALLSVRDGGERRVLVAVGRPYDDGVTSGSCCLSFGTVRLVGDRVAFDVIPDDLGSAEGITVVDLEADGRDELLVSMSVPPEPEDGPWMNVYTLLRQADQGFAAEPIEITDDDVAYFAGVGDTDGLPGDDLMFMTADSEYLVRVVPTDTGVRTERAPTAGLFDRRAGGWVAGATDGVLVFIADDGIATARWPRAGAIEPIATVAEGTFPSVYLVGSGPAARLVVATGFDFTSDVAELGIRVYDLDLELELELDVPPRVNDLWRAIQEVQSLGTELPNIYPQLGAIPGGLSDGRAGFLGLGHLLAIDDDGSHAVRDAGQLTGGDVMGLVGPGSAWLAHGSAVYGNGAYVWLGGYVEPSTIAGSRITVLPFDEILAAAENVELDVSLDGAAFRKAPEGPMVFAAEDGFRATVSGEPGSIVVTTTGTRASAEAMEDGQLTVTIDPGGSRGNREYDAGVFVISPGGLTRAAAWELIILNEPPEVSAGSSFELFDSRAKLVGQVTPHATVTVDGRRVTPNAAGEFRTMVDAWIWPRDVVVVATDPLGNEQVRHVEAVGFVDLRELPWIPIFVVLTIAAGVVLFLRVPTARPDQRLVPDGDGLLEELDGDSI